MGTDKFMEEIRALSGTMGRKNWKSPKSENGDVSKVLHEADNFMDRSGWTLGEASGDNKLYADNLKWAAEALMSASHHMAQGRKSSASFDVVTALSEFGFALKPFGVDRKFMQAIGKRIKHYESANEAALSPKPREQTQISVLAEEANAFMDRSGWVLNEARSKRTAQSLNHAASKLTDAAKYVMNKKRKYAAYEIQDALQDLARVFTEFGVEGHPLKAAMKALMGAEDQLEHIEEAENPPAPAKSPEKAYRLSVTLARKQPLRAAKYAIYGSILMAKRTQNKRLMVALGKAYQIVEEEVEKAEA